MNVEIVMQITFSLSHQQDQHGEDAYPEEADLEKQFQRYSSNIIPNVQRYSSNIIPDQERIEMSDVTSSQN